MLAFMPLPADPWLCRDRAHGHCVRAHGVNGCDQTSDSFLEKLHGYGYGQAKGTDTNKVYYQPSNWDWLAKKRKETFKFVINKKNCYLKFTIQLYFFLVYSFENTVKPH